MEYRTIDLDKAEQAVIQVTGDAQKGYQPQTLRPQNGGRSIYLPSFPSDSKMPAECLLLSNVPAARLGTREILRRQHGANTEDALMCVKNYDYRGEFALHEEDAEELSRRLKVDMSIILFNAGKLRGNCYGLMAYYQAFRRNILQKKDVASRESPLNSKTMAIALEFYLQMDEPFYRLVDIFFMKTCSFRGAQPRSVHEGLFCDKNGPNAKYQMTPCGNQFCTCCFPVFHWKKSQPWTVVDFVSSSTHQFLNGYTTYLNCPATCTTSDIVYCMTCPCGHFDYVDSTKQALKEAMSYHREHGNRLIHEYLTGSRVSTRSMLDSRTRDEAVLKKMRLYQHSARCPVALQSFLQCNPSYWCFIPMLWEDAPYHDIDSPRNRSAMDREALDTMESSINNDQAVSYLFDRVPLPPAAYVFSYRQRREQRLFFEDYLACENHRLPYIAVDLYKVDIIAVLPENCPLLLRYIIETLFIIHGETKLNMICPLGFDPEKVYGRVYNLVWCVGLNPLPVSASTSMECNHDTKKKF